jgi:hypothetical protein
MLLQTLSAVLLFDRYGCTGLHMYKVPVWLVKKLMQHWV